MEIRNIQVYGLKESILRSGYPMQTSDPDFSHSTFIDSFINEKDYKRSDKLSAAPAGSGHDNFLKGIIVQFDLQYPQYLTPQLQRYHWIDIISSQSKMHKLTSVNDIADNCNKYVLKTCIDTVNDLIYIYNNDNYPELTECRSIKINSKKECFNYIISNLPMGYNLWMGVSTNYLQLKTIYHQRKNHKLDEWRYFCNWIKSLPNSELIINAK